MVYYLGRWAKRLIGLLKIYMYDTYVTQVYKKECVAMKPYMLKLHLCVYE